MKYLSTFFASVLLSTGCVGLRQVDFVYFNLSGHEITVTNIPGLPPSATPGVLMPAPDDTNRLNRAGSTFFESVRVEDQITVFWQEDGVLREVKLHRSELGLPARLRGGQIRFTYLGGGKWRVRHLKENT